MASQSNSKKNEHQQIQENAGKNTGIIGIIEKYLGIKIPIVGSGSEDDISEFDEKSASQYPPDWQKRRKYVFERDNYTCQKCSSYIPDSANQTLHCDHIMPISKKRASPDYNPHEYTNLETLCEKCHVIKHPHLLNNFEVRKRVFEQLLKENKEYKQQLGMNSKNSGQKNSSAESELKMSIPESFYDYEEDSVDTIVGAVCELGNKAGNKVYEAGTKAAGKAYKAGGKIFKFIVD